MKLKGGTLRERFGIHPKDPEKEYTLATNTFIADKLIEEKVIDESKVDRYPASPRDILIEYVQKHGHLEAFWPQAK